MHDALFTPSLTCCAQGSTSFDPPHCNPVSFLDQWAALVIFYLATGGEYWIADDGWPNVTTFSNALDRFSSDPAINAGAVLDGATQLQLLNALPGSYVCVRDVLGHNLELPPHCCWYGVFCCLTPNCTEGRGSTIETCNCTVVGWGVRLSIIKAGSARSVFP